MVLLATGRTMRWSAIWERGNTTGKLVDAGKNSHFAGLNQFLI